MVRQGLTKKQEAILDFVEEFRIREAMAPTIDEIGKRFKISSPTAYAHLRSLERKGFVERSSKARSLMLTRTTTPKHLSMSLSIPILGRISAGLPLLATQNIEESITLDPMMLPNGVSGQALFGLRVHGESMTKKGIFNQDLLIAKQQSTAQIGNIVVALVDDEATVKSFFIKDQKVELRPANAKFESQYYDPKDVIIQGIVIALYRSYNGRN